MSEAKERRGGLVDDDGALAAAFGAASRPRRPRRPTPAPSEQTATETPTVGREAAPDVAPESATGEQAAEPAPLTVPAQPDPAPAGEPAPAPPGVRYAELAVREEPVHRPAPPPPAPVEPRPLRPLSVRSAPAPMAADQRAVQCTINVSASVRDRFAAYQLAQKVEAGAEPTNAVVVKRAVLRAYREDLWQQMREYVRHRQTPVFEEDDDPDGLFGEAPAGRQTVRGRARDTVQQSFRPTLAELARYDEFAAQQGFANRSEFLDAALELFLPALSDKRRR
ncbi:hypothetical protein [Streptomyces sp.]|uniref:hypothetical protein n=1 Tax=Streptomyces sp. TaxID=1931 RepID=UPI002F3F967D